MDQDVKERIEEELRNYPMLKSRIKIKTNKIAFQEDYSAKAVDYSKIPGGKTNSIYSDVESFVQTKLDRYPDLLELILKKEKIDAALTCLTWRQRKLVELKYFQSFTDYEIVFRMRDHERQIFRNSKGEGLDNYKEYSIPTIQRMKLDVLKRLHKAGFCEFENIMSRK